MKKLVLAVAAFALLCVVMFLVTHDTKEPERPKGRVILLIGSSLNDLGKVETAMDRSNYGESRRHLSTLRARLNELLHAYLESMPTEK